MLVRIAGVNPESVTDGEGVRAVVFLQGCQHACPGCHNPDSHPLDGGYLAETGELVSSLLANGIVSGLTISGGEPFLQPEATRALAEEAKRTGHSVWLYSGYRLEELLQNSDAIPILRLVDVLVDGRFLLEQLDLALPYRGSRNQRVLRSEQWLAALDETK